jgi:ATP-binding cassette subfamily C protein
LASISEGIGVAALLPLISLVIEGVADSEASAINTIILGAFEVVGLEPEFVPLLVLMTAGLVLKAVMTYFAMRFVGFTVAEVATDLRTELIARILAARWSFFVTQPAGRIANAISNEAQRAAQAYQFTANFLANAVQTVVYLGIALLLSWQLTLAALTFGAVVVLCLGFLIGIARRAGQKQTDRVRDIVIYLNDVLSNIKPLKAMARQPAFQSYLDGRIAKLRKSLRTLVTTGEALKSSQDVLIALATGIGIYLAFVVLQVALTKLVVMYLVVVKIVKNIARLQQRYQKVVAAEPPHRAVKNLIKEAGRAAEPIHAGAAPTFEKGCCFEEVSFAFGEKMILDRADLVLPARSFTVLTGLSGAGKSTLTDLLLGLRAPASGRILVDGVPLEELDWTKWRRMIGYVPQDLQLIHDTIRTNVSLGDPQIGLPDVEAALRTAEAWEFVSALPNGVESHVGERGAQLSGGQRQRIMLARALAMRPKLLILDEVSSALDVETERDVCATLSRLTDRLAILAITHRPAFLEMADQICHLEAGRIRRAADVRPLSVEGIG